MLHAAWTDQGTVIAREADLPPLKPGWARLKVAACGICGSDLHRYGHPGPAGGAIPGHEFVGTIVQADSSLADTLYAAEQWVACGACDFCLAGQRQHCTKGFLIGVQTAGGLAELADMPINEIHPLDPSLAPVVASMTEPLAVCTRAVHRAGLRFDSRVFIIGSGTLGLLTGMLARDAGGRVALTVRHPHQAEAAKKLGLETVPEADWQAFAADFQPDAVFETVGGRGSTVEQAIQAARPGGRIVVLGLFSTPSQLDNRALVMKEVTITGSKVYGMSDHGHEFRAAAGLMPRYQTELGVLQTHQFPLSRVDEAFATAADKTSHAIKVTVQP